MTMATDPVCGMTVDEASAAGTSVFDGRTFYFCSAHCLRAFEANPKPFVASGAAPVTGKVAAGHARPAAPAVAKATKATKDMAKDPICGMVVDKATALKSERAGRAYYFCSIGCQRTFESPEAELKSMRTRVAIALTGVLLLAILRAAAFIALAAGATIVTWAPIPQLPWFTWGMWLFLLVTPVQFIGGWSFYKGSYNAIKNRMINMDALIALGTSVAYLYSVIVIFAPDILPIKIAERDVYFEVSAVIIAFVLLGKYMEEIIKKKSSAAVRKLLDLKPQTAHVIREGQEMEIPAEFVQIGDVIVVRPGEKMPADGVVTEGSSAVDEKMITGESIPVEKKAGDEVIGGTINKVGMLKFRARRVGAETTLSQIIKMVEEAQASTAPIQRIADQAAGYFVPAVVIAAFLAFFGWWIMGNFPQGLLSFIAVLIIACPCALGIATPAALMVGVGKGAEAGILIRGGEYLEKAQSLDTVVFDKTGTLTIGEPFLKDVIALAGDEDDVLGYAAIAEYGSEHPIAKAILNAAKMRGIPAPEPETFEAMPGQGVRVTHGNDIILLGNRTLMRGQGVAASAAEEILVRLETQGKTAMLVSKNGVLTGVIAVADTIKPHAREAVESLKKEGVNVIMLTGDNERTARAVARELGIDEVLAGVLPKDKAGVIMGIKAKGKVVAMVGDGINDAPALAESDIGIAIGSGSDVAKETGGIILIRD